MAETARARKKRYARIKEKRKDRVLRALDLRRVESREVEAWRKELTESLGGTVSPGKRELVEQACLLKSLLNTVTRTMLEKANEGKPIGASLRDHARLTAELKEILTAIGAKDELSLDKIRRELSA